MRHPDFAGVLRPVTLVSQVAICQGNRCTRVRVMACLPSSDVAPLAGSPGGSPSPTAVTRTFHYAADDLNSMR